jgi:hypothetical protein
VHDTQSCRGKSVEEKINSNEFAGRPDDARKTRNPWIYPEGEKKDVVGDFKFLCKEAKDYLGSIELLYPVCLPETYPKRERFKNAVRLFKQLIELLDKHEDYTDQELETMDQVIYEFSEEWVDITGRDGYTNYFHFIISGHLLYFAKKYKNFHRFSEQGFEAQNARFNYYYHHHTQKGCKDTLVLEPIYKYIQRSHGWRNGCGDKFFDKDNFKEDKPSDNEYDDELSEEQRNALEAALIDAVAATTMES